jgi:hypothetical protein
MWGQTTWSSTRGLTWGFTVKAAGRAKLVIAVEPDPGMGKGMKRLFAISKRDT